MVWGTNAWSLDGRDDPFDWTIERLLIGAMVFMPLAFGAVDAWSEEVVLVLTAALCTCFLLKIIVKGRASIRWTWAYVPIALFLLVVVIQLVPLPSVLVRLISPNTAALKTELLGDLPTARGVLWPMTLTFYAHATRHDLRLVLAAVVVFVVVFNVYRRSDQVVRLLSAITIVGAAAASLCVLQNIVGNDKIYWFVSSPHGTAHSGPFVNHSHYAQFMNLSVGAALGLIFVRVHQSFQDRRATPVTVAEYLSSPDARIVWAVAAMVTVGVASVFLSLSRGGMISTMLAGAFTTLILTWRKSLRGPAWIMALLALGAFICVLYVGFDAVYDRLGTLRELQRAEGGRWQVARDVAVAWTRFPLVGTGLGSHEVVYPMFDRSRSPALASHAENEYAQAAEEVGVIGLAALAIFGVVIWSRYARAVRGSRVPLHSAAFGLGFGLMAILVHSLSDFGQHMPANALLSATFCALVLRLPDSDRWEENVPREADPGARARRWGVVGLAVSSVVWGWVLFEADAARRGELYWSKALAFEGNLAERNWQGSDEEYTALLDAAAKAHRYRPANIKYCHWLNVYRWHAISRDSDPNTGQVVLSPAALPFVERITDELKQSLLMCPTYGPSWCVLGQLERFVLQRDEEGARHVRRGRQLAPCDPTACLVAGMLHAEEGDPVAAFQDWKRAIELDERLFDEASHSLLLLGRPDLACELAQDKVRWLVVLERALKERVAQLKPHVLARVSALPGVFLNRPGSLRRRIRDAAAGLVDIGRSLADLGAAAESLDSTTRRIGALMQEECQAPDTPAWKLVWMAKRYSEDGATDQAVQMYRRALLLEYGQVRWRLSLARLLADQGMIADAMRELNTCLRLQPESGSAKRFLDELSAQVNIGGGHP